MGHRNNPTQFTGRRGGGNPNDDADWRNARDNDYQADPYMVGNNTYRESMNDNRGHEGPGYYGGSRPQGRYEGAGSWDTDEDRARRGHWHSDDYRRARPGMPPPQGPYDPYDDPRYAADRDASSRRSAGYSPAGGYGRYGRSDGSYGDAPYPGSSQQRQHQHPHDPDYHQWRSEQMDKLDKDYRSWREERYQRFSEDFDSWRSKRAQDEATQAAGQAGQAGTADEGSTAKPGRGK